jgi:hypothetical protein
VDILVDTDIIGIIKAIMEVRNITGVGTVKEAAMNGMDISHLLTPWT